MDDLEQRVNAAVDRLAPIPGVQTWPGATEREIDEAERQLGIRLPTVHRAFLRRTNGLSIAFGQSRLFGVGTNAPVGLVWFNDQDTWRWAYPDRADIDQMILVGMEDLPTLVGYRRADLRDTQDDLEVLAGPIELPGYLTSQVPLIELLERSFAAMANNPYGDSELSQYARTLGPIAIDQGVVPGPSYFWELPGVAEHEGAGTLPLKLALVAFADLYRGTDGVPASKAVTGIEPLTDAHGRARWRWSTTDKPSGTTG